MSSFSPMVGLQDVKQAIISLLSQPPLHGQAPLIVYYLAELERTHGLAPRTIPTPPDSESYYGGIDFLSWDEAYLPSIIVVCDPTGTPERHEGGEYGQWFRTQVASIVQGDTEDAAQTFAAHYGTAIAGALLQQGTLGGIATETHMAATPVTTFLEDPATRVFARSVAIFDSYVQPVTVAAVRPPSWAFDPYGTPGVYPDVTAVDVEFIAIDQQGTI